MLSKILNKFCYILFFLVFLFLKIGIYDSFAYFYNISGSIILNEEKIYDNTYLFGNDIKIFNEIKGDAYIGSIFSNINSTIDGDLVLSSINASLDQTTNVLGDVRILAVNTVINPATISGEMILIGLNIEVKPQVKINKDALIIGNNVILGGEYNSNVEVYANNISVLPNTKIKGNLKYTSTSEINNVSKYVDGNVIFNKISLEDNKKTDLISDNVFFRNIKDFWFIWNILGISLLVFIFYLIFPAFFHRFLDYFKNNLGYSYISGFLFIFIGSIVSLFCIIAYLPVGLFLFNLWIIFTFLIVDVILVAFFLSFIKNVFTLNSNIITLISILMITFFLKLLIIWILSLKFGIIILLLLYFLIYMPILGSLIMILINYFKS